ncbi:phage major capsid protein [Chachezhania sediminis]|uniref:phage major capsid protein n=1 Tax=Chachezhania sediminis TaxID=2599291 RepID=UPI00131D1CF9|nr:Mu-like prophage major head subunit gpT family protein [Chachezhania sediminis]
MLDFKKTPSGEPSPRFLAQVQMRVRKIGLPSELGRVLALRMEAPKDLDEHESFLSGVSNFAKANKIAADDLVAYVEQAISDETSQEGDEVEDPEEDGASPTARIMNRIISMVQADRPKPKARPGLTRADMMAGIPGAPGRNGQRTQLIQMLSDRIDGRANGADAMSLPQIAMAMARAAGHHPRSLSDAVRMATHATSDFPQVLEGAIANSVARRLEQVMPALLRASHVISANDYRQGKLLDLSASGIPQEIGEGGEIKHVTIDERGELKPAPRDFGSGFNISNKALINDNMSMFDQISTRMTAGANERLRQVLLEPLLANGGLGHAMADGLPVFHESHGNLAAAGAALSVTSLSAARIALRTQKGSQGELYGYEPWALVVPPQLETQAQQIVAEITAATVSEVNPFSGTLEVIVEAGLTNPQAWYLIANPGMHDGLARSYLNDGSSPTFESRPGWHSLGLEFRMVWALDARFVAASSWYKNPGE